MYTPDPEFNSEFDPEIDPEFDPEIHSPETEITGEYPIEEALEEPWWNIKGDPGVDE